MLMFLTRASLVEVTKRVIQLGLEPLHVASEVFFTEMTDATEEYVTFIDQHTTTPADLAQTILGRIDWTTTTPAPPLTTAAAVQRRQLTPQHVPAAIVDLESDLLQSGAGAILASPRVPLVLRIGGGPDWTVLRTCM